MRTALISCIVLSGCSSPAAASDPNAMVLAVLREYPLDGSFGYHWPRSGPEASWDGTTEEFHYEGVRLTQGDPQRRSYCCGLTYEVFLKAQRRLAGRVPFPGVGAADLQELRLRWYGNSTQAPERRRLVAFAIESMAWGAPVARLDDARPGDFVQFWRHNGSGHSAVFIGWVREQGRITGLTYWSSQASTKGIGEATERVGTGGIKPEEIYLARLGRR